MKTPFTLIVATMAILLIAGCTQHPPFVEVRYSEPPPVTRQGLSGKPILRTGEIDGAHFVLIESTFVKDGKRVTCEQFVDRVERDLEQPEPKTTINVAYECWPS